MARFFTRMIDTLTAPVFFGITAVVVCSLGMPFAAFVATAGAFISFTMGIIDMAIRP